MENLVLAAFSVKTLSKRSQRRGVFIPRYHCVLECPVDEVFNEASDACEVCPNGQTSNGAGDACVLDCPVGQVPNGAGDACEACPPGHVPNGAGEACEALF